MAILQGNYNFDKDISIGERGEDILIEKLAMLNFKFLNKNKDYRYDYKMLYDNREITYEQKTDMFPRDTGNMVIEFQSRGKWSGISVTEADYFVYYFAHFGEVWNIRVEDLRKLINYINPPIANGGDLGSNTLMYKMSKNRVRKFFRVYKI